MFRAFVEVGAQQEETLAAFAVVLSRLCREFNDDARVAVCLDVAADYAKQMYEPGNCEVV